MVGKVWKGCEFWVGLLVSFVLVVNGRYEYICFEPGLSDWHLRGVIDDMRV